MKARILSIIVLMLGLLSGMSLSAYATTYESLTVGTVLHVGDAINSSTWYRPASGVSLNPNGNPWTLVRADIVIQYMMASVTESETGAYYLFKDNDGDYLVSYYPEEGIKGLGTYVFEVTGTSDGIIVQSISGQDVTFAIHEAAGYSVGLKAGTADADKWTVKVGTGDAQTLPVTGLEGGETVTATYSGTKKVKSVKAKKKN